jgi:PmbA protein
MNVEKILRMAENLGLEAEIFIEETRVLELNFHGDGRRRVELHSFSEMAVRVIKDGYLGYASSSLSVSPDEIVKKAVKNARIPVKFSFPSSLKISKVKGIFDEDLANLDLKTAEEKMREFLSSSNSRISKPSYASLSFSTSSKTILNSYGCELKEKETLLSAEIEVVSKEFGKVSSAFQSNSSRSLSFSLEELGKRAKEKAEKSLKSSKISSGNYPVVFHPDALSELLEYTLIPALSGYNVLKGKSPLSGKIDEKVASEEITLYDSGVLEGGISSSSFDDEGVPTKETPLILRGVLKSFYHDLLTSSELQIQSTGNGFRESCEFPVRPSPTNLVLKPSSSLDLPERFIYVQNLIGAHTSNPITGDFAVEGRNCVLWSNTSEKPISSCMLSGNIYEILLSALPVGEMKRSHNFYMPDILIPSLKVVT